MSDVLIKDFCEKVVVEGCVEDICIALPYLKKCENINYIKHSPLSYLPPNIFRLLIELISKNNNNLYDELDEILFKELFKAPVKDGLAFQTHVILRQGWSSYTTEYILQDNIVVDSIANMLPQFDLFERRSVVELSIVLTHYKSNPTPFQEHLKVCERHLSPCAVLRLTQFYNLYGNSDFKRAAVHENGSFNIITPLGLYLDKGLSEDNPYDEKSVVDQHYKFRYFIRTILETYFEDYLKQNDVFKPYMDKPLPVPYKPTTNIVTKVMSGTTPHEKEIVKRLFNSIKLYQKRNLNYTKTKPSQKTLSIIEVFKQGGYV